MQPESPEHTTAPDGRPMEKQPKWRRDFPVSVAPGEYIARRDFVKFLVLTSGAFAAGQLWIGASSLQRQSTTEEPGRLRIARDADVAVGGTISFRYPREEDTCLLIRQKDGSLVAYDQKCTHLSCAVLPNVASGELVCPCHHGLFDLASGRPTAGPARRPLPRIRLEVVNGEIYAVGVEKST